MKEGWTYKKLGEITISMADGPFGSNMKAEHYTDHKEVRIIQLSNIGEEGWREENVKYTTFEHLESIKRSEVQPDDIVIAKMMPAGRAILCPHHEKKYVLSSDAVRATLVEGVDKKFILYSINSPYFRKQVYANVSGSGRVRTSLTKLRDCSIPIPSLEVQQRIVERLDAAFENIDKLKANAGKQLAEAQTLFQKSLAKAMEPKEGWEEKTMSEITEVKDGTHDSPKYVTEGIPFVTQKNITINGVDLINTKKITLEDHKKFYTRSNVEFGDIIIAMIGANRGMSCIVNTREIFSIKNVGLIKKTDNINMRFLLYYLHSPAANSYVLENSNGGAQEFIGLKGLRNFPIQFPSLAEQQRIVERLDSLSENIRKYEEIQRQIISECDALKQALLRKVFE